MVAGLARVSFGTFGGKLTQDLIVTGLLALYDGLLLLDADHQSGAGPPTVVGMAQRRWIDRPVLIAVAIGYLAVVRAFA